MVDFPEAGHDQAHRRRDDDCGSRVATIESVRINDRAGLATDVSAARAIASSLRSLTIPNYPNLLINAFGSAVCNLNPAAAPVPSCSRSAWKRSWKRSTGSTRSRRVAC